MIEHTPGPWDDGTTERAQDLRLGIEVSDWAHLSANGNPIGSAYCGASYEHNLANARMMAAAPDLLHALERALDEGVFDTGWQSEARAAIAKARGET